MDEPNETYKVASEYLKARNVTGNVIFSMLTGSTAYNLTTSSSDKDYLGVYVVDTKSLLSIDGELSFPNDAIATLPNDNTYPDTTLYEIKQYLKLMVKGNPFMIEMLFAHQHITSSPSWDRLRSLRHNVLSCTLVDEFLSYIRGQMAVHRKKGLKGKRIYHIIRLLYELRRIIAGKEPIISFPEGEEKARLVEIRSIENPGEEILDEAQLMIDEIESQRSNWKLLKEVNEEPFNQWLIEERLSRLSLA